ncbi:hypothetical protein PDJAM_G00094620 [Pangasius djambal]|uniref:Uncharacterized protein n=1 Tax=Pangasius djambal TaxID=1691987 RepID=A0ACC5Z5V8_9TELE|nr:hypothetical protein [Pangasius djambal]
MDNKIFGVLLGRWKRKNISSNRTGSIIEGSSPSNVKGFHHIFPRRYVYHVSTTACSSHVPSSNTETFKFTDK